MDEVQRYRLALAEKNELTRDGMKRDRAGQYVTYADHLRQLQAQQERIAALESDLAAQFRAASQLADGVVRLTAERDRQYEFNVRQIAQQAELEASLQSAQETLQGLRKVASELTDAMETCHICKGTVLVEEQPVHCEDCSWDCDNHEGSECPTLYGLHLALKNRLTAINPPAPKEPQ